MEERRNTTLNNTAAHCLFRKTRPLSLSGSRLSLPAWGEVRLWRRSPGNSPLHGRGWNRLSSHWTGPPGPRRLSSWKTRAPGRCERYPCKFRSDQISLKQSEKAKMYTKYDFNRTYLRMTFSQADGVFMYSAYFGLSEESWASQRSCQAIPRKWWGMPLLTSSCKNMGNKNLR